MPPPWLILQGLITKADDSGGHSEKESAASQNLPDLRSSLHMEEEMGTLLGGGALLLGALSAS